LHQVGDLFELNVTLRCQKVKVCVGNLTHVLCLAFFCVKKFFRFDLAFCYACFLVIFPLVCSADVHVYCAKPAYVYSYVMKFVDTFTC